MDCTSEAMEECLQKVREGSLSQRQAAEILGVHRNTISNKLAGKHESLPGKISVILSLW